MCTHRPVFVMIISVPRSWNLSHSSLVSRWHSACNSSSQLHRIFTLAAAPAFSSAGSGESPSLSSPCSDPDSEAVCFGSLLTPSRCSCCCIFSLSEHSSTSTSISSSSSSTVGWSPSVSDVWIMSTSSTHSSWLPRIRRPNLFLSSSLISASRDVWCLRPADWDRRSGQTNEGSTYKQEIKSSC